MDHPICSQGDSDAHLLLRSACEQLGRVRKSTGERRSRKSLKMIQEDLDWKRWDRIQHAMEDLLDDSDGKIWSVDGALFIEEGFVCTCGRTRARSSVLDSASSAAKTRTRARGYASPPTPPPTSTSSSDGGRSFPGLDASRRSADSSGRRREDRAPAPNVVPGRRIQRRSPEQKKRARRLQRLGKPASEYTANDLAHHFVDVCRRRFDTFEQQENPVAPLARFFAKARRGDDGYDPVDSATLKDFIDDWLETYDGSGPPWRLFISTAPKGLASRRTRTAQFEDGGETLTYDEIMSRYRARPDHETENPGDD